MSAGVGYFSSMDTIATSNVISNNTNNAVVLGLGGAGSSRASVGSARVRGVMTVTAACIGLAGGGVYAFQNAYGTSTAGAFPLPTAGRARWGPHAASSRALSTERALPDVGPPDQPASLYARFARSHPGAATTIAAAARPIDRLSSGRLIGVKPPK